MQPAQEGGPLPRWVVLGYSAVLALTAGFVNAVAILLLAFPVANVTAATTQLGMNTANPWLYEGHLLGAIIFGFLVGAAIAGAVLAPTQAQAGMRHAALLFCEATLLGLAAAGLEDTPVRTLLSTLGLEQPILQAVCAATALGMQNGLTSSFRGMAVRTTHFTGTITDLGLMIGRSRQHGLEKWKVTVLSVTFVLFLTGGVIGLLVGSRLGGWSLVIPMVTCLAVAAGCVVHSRSRGAERDDAVAESVPA
ncbi:YoaK family protein [Mycobacterium gordonae]|uniref:DUF1275 domain-containing protein n=2 Tax=Mycobacterium TaxID=1763 RepID=A0A1X1VWB4_MYCGO|nr:YoaK family protein [Mycobacterium gordonae]MBI2702840.1 DUF1275 domain-containing protein [Mycobacterium sp.]MBX9983195.1 DUF1275 domain-containing protein [Mycobacterium gordonae]MCV7007577.1 DUF1275 domain-containing protein [Mycobacterium gordonae]ODR16827.1 hypothetical protein BHQ23_28575 [Mycobacterium gordonae]ORV73335.1 hypothetical protein AWC08_02170 [Mycobacterium gordonae]